MSKKEAFIFEVSKKNFDSTVIKNSQKIPVIVEFMRVWSGPCIQMSDELSNLAQEFAGQFIFAKVDIDEQPELMNQYEIKNLPALNVFVDGAIVNTQEGLLNESELRSLLKEVDVYSQTDELRQAAREKHIAGDSLAAIQLLTQAMKEDPSSIRVALDMTQVLIDLNEIDQAKGLFNQLPASAKSNDMGKSIVGQLAFCELAEKTQGKINLQQSLIANPTDCDAHFDLSVCLIVEKDYEQAVEHLFKIMEINPDYKDNAAKEMIINVCNMLRANNPELSSKFRSKLSSISFL